MKILKSLILAFSVLGIATSINGEDQQCKGDYDCGVGFPYAACNGALNVYPGISLDSKGNVIITGKFNSTDQGPFGNPAVFEIPTSGGSSNQIVKKFDIKGEIAAGAGSNHLFSFYDYLPLEDYYYVLMNQAGAPIFSYFTGTNTQVQRVFNVFNTPFVPVFDEVEKAMYYGAYGIFKINKLPTGVADSQLASTIYKSQIINGLAKDGKDLYMSTYDGSILKGSTDCLDCEKDKLQVLVSNDTNIGKLTDFILAGNNIFYSYSNGIVGYPKTGGSNSKVLVSGESVQSMVSKGNTIYYTTSTGIVKSIDIDGKNGKTLYTPSSNHKCSTAVGFESTDGKCNNGKILWYNGLPTCTKLTPSGLPEQCFNSNDCGSTPYFVCTSEAKCSCAGSFTGNDCQTCKSGKVDWINGNPICKE